MSFEDKPYLESVVVEQYMNFVFLVEMIRIFTTPIDGPKNRKVYDHRYIAMTYIKGGFIMDAYAMIPYAFFRYNSNRDDGNLNDLYNLITFNYERLPRFYKMMIFPQILRARNIIHYLNFFLKTLKSSI